MMIKNQRLDDVQINVFKHLWLNGPIVSSRKELSEELNIPVYLLGKTINELSEKRWIRKIRQNKGLRFEITKKAIPNYIVKKAEEDIEKL